MFMKRFVFACVLFLTTASIAQAVELVSVANVSIENIRIETISGKNSLTFVVKNNNSEPIKGVFGVRVQKQGGETVYTNTNSQTDVREEMISEESVPFIVPEESGSYDIFANFSSVQGVPLAVLFADTIVVRNALSPVVNTEENDNSRSVCTYVQGTFSCDVPDSSIQKISYAIFKGGVSGEKVLEGEASRNNTVATIELTEYNLDSGRYGAVFSFLDERGNVVHAQELFFVHLLHSWASIDIVSIDSTKDNFTARAFLAGMRTNEEMWGLWYWILDAQGTICAHEKQRFGDVLPREYSIHQKLTQCAGSRLVAALHLGTHPDGTLNIVDTYGDADIAALVAQTADIPAISQEINKKDSYIFWVLIAGFAFCIVAILGAISRSRLFVLVLLMWGIYAVPAHAATFVSGNETFTVTLEKTTYQNNETIDFTFSIVDSTTGQKPVGDSVRVRVDSGAYTTIVATNNTATLYNVSLPAVSAGGSHNLNFIAPGHFFGSALFGSFRFGIADRQFSVPFSVVANTAPTPPTVSGSCVIGQTNTYYFTATDPNSDAIYYEAYFNAEISNERIPGVGYVASGTQMSTTRAKSISGNESVHVRATDSLGNASAWNNQTVICVDACSHCTYNGGAPSTTFGASPSLVFKEATSVLSWELENVTNCSITSNHPQGDAWDWNTVRTVQSVSTSPIVGSTLYTMECERVDGSLADPMSARVDLVPTFEEF